MNTCLADLYYLQGWNHVLSSWTEYRGGDVQQPSVCVMCLCLVYCREFFLPHLGNSIFLTIISLCNVMITVLLTLFSGLPM